MKPEGYPVTFLRSLLLNPVYRGDVVYGRTKERKARVGNGVKRRKDTVPEDEWVVSHAQHEALVDEETWNIV